MYSCDCYRLNVLFIIIIKAEERLHHLSQLMCCAGVWLFLASKKEFLENKYCFGTWYLTNSHLH